jgi:hypothetical protein
MMAVCDRILPQDDRDASHKIPVVNAIDERLCENRPDGYRYEDMPPDQEAHRLGLEGIEKVAQYMFGKPYIDLSVRQQESVLETLHDGNPPAAHDIWKQMDVKRFWLLLVQDVVGAYYAHPYAWDEIGFGGPAYPRGYMRLEGGEPELWEVDERLYEWAPPAGSPSAKFTKVGGVEEREASPGQGGALRAPFFGRFKTPADSAHMLGAMQRLEFPMQRYGNNEEVDYCIVGVGSAGGVLLQRLARAGFSVLGLEAGPFWDTERDWVSDEAGSHKLYWNELRITGGKEPQALGANNSGRGVGGGSVHWAGFTPRLHPSDFCVHTQDGVGGDWPISYDDLKPYYELLEKEIPVSGPAYFPWGHPHGYSYGPHPMGGCGDILIKGCAKLGIRVSIGGPVAILAGSHGNRPHCIYRGFCIQGCKVGAKQSTLISHVPDAIEHKAEIRAHCMASRINLGEDGRVTGVTYFDSEGKEAVRKAKAIIVCGYAIETPGCF